MNVVVNPEDVDKLQQFEDGEYTVRIMPAATETDFTGEILIVWQIGRNPQPVNVFEDFFYIGPRHHHDASFCADCKLPATGFSSRVSVPLSVKPTELEYANLNMSIQIPSLNVNAEIAGVPMMDKSWAVEWLGDKAGLLSGSHLPGEGTAVIAAHNTLNNTEFGPFALLATLEENDVMFIDNGDRNLDQYRVYANKLMGPNDMGQVIALAEQVDNSLVLVTCENESVDGGYQNRRVVFAKPF